MNDRIDSIRSIVHSNKIQFPNDDLTRARRRLSAPKPIASMSVGEPLKNIKIYMKTGPHLECVDYARMIKNQNNSSLLVIGDLLIPKENIQYIHIGAEVFKDLAGKA